MYCLRMARLSMLLGLAAVTLCAVRLSAEENVPPAGFTALFNGEDLSGWHGQPHFDPRKLDAMDQAEREQQIADWTEEAKKHWRVQDGELINDGKGPYLTTDREFGDIELWIDYKTVPKADSGIYLRGTPQVQIWDYTREGGKWNRGADKGSGGLFNNSPGTVSKEPLVLADKPFGQWNRFRILQIGERTSVWLNDQQVVDHAVMENYWDRGRPLFANGRIQLQTHGGEIRWRNIFVREISADEANDLLAQRDAEAFEPIFDGESFDGWTGAVDNYDIVNGTIVCKPGKGGVLFTKEEFDDFIVRLEYRVPPGGNNGLVIRYPGEGRASRTAMCELQILDHDHEKYKGRLDPRQFHGSAYGMVAAHPGYLRVGDEWNFQQVTVKGHTLKVELNGATILDADLSQVTETKNNEPHPGKDRLSGHFGFAGHNDPVAFRNIQIRRLDPR